MAPEKDYTHRSWIAVTLLIAVLIGLSLIPPQTLGGVSLRRANILSDLISFEEDLEKAEKAIDLDDADFHIDLTQVARQIADTVPQHAPTTYEWNLREEADDTTAQPRLPDSVRLSPTLIPIEDFDTTGHSRLTAFYEKLQKGDAPVRIAVMGDSFVEGDILSSDLREKLQLRFGGSGAGFAPMASPLTGFRRTIKTQSKGWELMIDWFPLLGNHEYRGNTQAVLDYSNISRRWTMPARYYTKTFEDNGATIRILWVDTAPMIDKYRNDSETYPDACKQDYQQQLSWIDSVLTAAKEDWVIVAGHHPIYAETPKDESERADMQARLDPILRKHKVDMYICGHIHNFQHVRMAGSDIDYITNSAGSLARKVKPIEGTVFCSPEPGFSIVSASKKTLELRMIDKKGNVLHTVTRSK